MEGTSTATGTLTGDGGSEGEATGSGDGNVRVLSYNILAGGGRRLPAIEQVIADAQPDIVGVVEVTQTEPIRAMAERLGMYCAFGEGATDWNVAVLSRWPIRRSQAGSGGVMRRTLLETEIETPDGAQLHFFVTHLAAEYQSAFAGEGRRLREIRYVLDVLERTRQPEMATLLVGDFNTLPPDERLLASRILKQAIANSQAKARGKKVIGLPTLSTIIPAPLKLLQPVIVRVARSDRLCRVCDEVISFAVPRAVVRRVERAGYIDCYAQAHPDPRDRDFSCPSTAPAGRIDYVFADPRTALQLRSCEILTDTPARPVREASDHRPVLASFQLVGSSASNVQNAQTQAQQEAAGQ